MSNLLANYIDNFFDDANYSSSRGLSTYGYRSGTMPAINIREYDDKYTIKLTIPGLDADDVHVEMLDNTLKISYEHEEEKNEEEGRALREEYAHYSFARSILLPNNVDKKSLKAKAKQGVLTVTIAKLPETKPERITVEKED